MTDDDKLLREELENRNHIRVAQNISSMSDTELTIECLKHDVIRLGKELARCRTDLNEIRYKRKY